MSSVCVCVSSYNCCLKNQLRMKVHNRTRRNSAMENNSVIRIFFLQLGYMKLNSANVFYFRCSVVIVHIYLVLYLLLRQTGVFSYNIYYVKIYLRIVTMHHCRQWNTLALLNNIEVRKCRHVLTELQRTVSVINIVKYFTTTFFVQRTVTIFCFTMKLGNSVIVLVMLVLSLSKEMLSKSPFIDNVRQQCLLRRISFINGIFSFLERDVFF